MNDLFAPYRRSIASVLASFLKKKQQELYEVSPFGRDVGKRLEAFQAGKMLRGSLTILGFEMFGRKANSGVYNAAAGMELIHSGLLIHDDIIDRDTKRRDMDTIFTQYEKLGKQQNIPNSSHFGLSLGICVGDAAFFLAYELLPKAITFLVASEITKVCIAQMQDAYLGTKISQPSEETILNLYRYKTSRYTFSVPLMVGATLAGQPEQTIKNLERLGEDLGMLFQLKDDELDVEGDEREGKKTFFTVYGEKRTDEKIKDLTQKSKQYIHELQVEEKWKHVLLELLEYNRNRTK